MSHVLRVGVPDQIAYFRAYNTDGSANTSLTASTTGLTLSVFRVGLLPTSILTLSNKAADNTAHSDGAIRNVGGNLYTIDIPDAACATQCPSICVRGSYTGGVIEGLEHPITAYDPAVNYASSSQATAIETDTVDIQARIPAALVGGRIDASVGAYQTGLAPPTAAENGAAGWNRMLVDHTSTGSFGWVVGLFFQLIENVTGWRFTTKALEQAPGGSASGSGARTVTVTVNDGTNPLQNATVRMSEGANTYIATTNSSGVATFNLDELVFTVAITKAGYQFNGDSLTVDGNETVTYSMTAISITPSNPSSVTGYYTCYSELGVVESGVTIELQVHKVPSETGLALDSAIRTAISDSNGLAQFTNLVPGTTYQVRRNQGQYYTFKIADNASGSVELNSIIGT